MELIDFGPSINDGGIQMIYLFFKSTRLREDCDYQRNCRKKFASNLSELEDTAVDENLHIEAHSPQLRGVLLSRGLVWLRNSFDAMSRAQHRSDFPTEYINQRKLRKSFTKTRVILYKEVNPRCRSMLTRLLVSMI